MTSFFFSLLGIFLTIVFIIGIHEYGHFIVARLVGVKILRFSIGFGKPLLRWHDKKGTEYALAAIPLGGYVKMLDEHEGPVAEHERQYAYNRQSIIKKMAIVSAGPLANILFALVLYWLIYLIGFTSIIPITGKITAHSIADESGLTSQQEIISINHRLTPTWISVMLSLMPTLGDQTTLTIATQSLQTKKITSHQLNLAHWQVDALNPQPLSSLGITPYQPAIPAIISIIIADSPAAQAGLKLNDKILAIAGKPIADWQQALKFITTHPAQSVIFKILRHGKIVPIKVFIASKQSLFTKKTGYLGIGTDFSWPKKFLRYNQYSPYPALKHALENTYGFIYLNFILLGKIITGKVSLQSLGGPITIFTSAGAALNNGFMAFISFLAFLSISIAVLNILPIPGLDGGHLLFQLVEAVCRRPIALRLQFLLYRLGLIFLFVLIVQALVNDILRLSL